MDRSVLDLERLYTTDSIDSGVTDAATVLFIVGIKKGYR